MLHCPGWVPARSLSSHGPCPCQDVRLRRTSIWPVSAGPPRSRRCICDFFLLPFGGRWFPGLRVQALRREKTRPAVSGHTSTTACGQGHSCEWRPSSVAVTRHHAPFWRQGARYIPTNAGCRGHTHTAAHAVPVPGTRHIQQIRGPAFPLAPPACVAPGKAGNGQLGDAGREVLPVFAMRRLRQTGRRLASCASRLSPRAGRRSCWRGWELGAGSWSCQNESVQGCLLFRSGCPSGDRLGWSHWRWPNW